MINKRAFTSAEFCALVNECEAAPIPVKSVLGERLVKGLRQAARQAEQIERVFAAAPCEEWLPADPAGLMLRECRVLPGWHTMETHAYKQPAWLRAVLVAESAPEAVGENG